MNRSILVASTVALVSAANLHDRKFYEEKFYEWLNDFKESVEVKDGSHFVHMLQNFANNHDVIEQHNARNLSYTLGHNAFSHMSYEEWVENMRFGLGKPDHEPADYIHEAPEDGILASSVDWVTNGAVTPVKNQGNCGSCWSFSATGALEGLYKVKKGTLNSYSEQELVSCDTGGIFGDKGCNGGLMDNAFKWVKSNGGLCYESAYSYTSGSTGENGACKDHSSCDDKSLKLTGYVDVKKNDDKALTSAVSQQPVAVAIQASAAAFQLYKSGVLTDTCGANLDHGVLAVGFGTDSKAGDYWKIKNSWGASWGESGYVRIAKGESYNSGKGQCGIYSGPPSYPTM